MRLKITLSGLLGMIVVLDSRAEEPERGQQDNALPGKVSGTDAWAGNRSIDAVY